MSKTANITEFLNSRKVELSSEAVNLGLAQDMLVFIKDAQDLFSTGSSMEDRLKEEIRTKVASVYNDSALNAQRALDVYSQIEQKTKELGLEVPSDTKKAADRMKQYLKDAKDRQDKAKNIK